MFLINRGVVEDIVQNILAINFTRPKEVLQSCFDMLGELIKFNVNGFQLLDKELNETDKFNMFLTMINQSLIDSNMFLRSVFLSLEFFDLKSSLLEFNLNSNKILVFFSVFERRVSFICRMMSIINIHNLSQENISCLNTTLIVLMLANKRNILPEYLRAIKSKSIDIMLNSELFHFNRNESSSAATNSRENSSTSSDLITNLRDLLVFWQVHYLQKDKDCFGLEQNSRIEFAYWKHTVELLLDSNKKNECSLSYYMHNDFNTLNNRNRIDEYRSD
jgi:Trpc4-associated protein